MTISLLLTTYFYFYQMFLFQHAKYYGSIKGQAIENPAPNTITLQC